MIHCRKILVCLLFVTALLIAAGETARGDSVMPENIVPRRVESKAVQLMHELEKQGFEVSRGYFKLWTVSLPRLAQEVNKVYGNQEKWLTAFEKRTGRMVYGHGAH